MRRTLTPLLLLLALGSCSSPPKPPTVDESRKRPVNAMQAIELQVCRTELQNTQILANETQRAAAAAMANAAQMATQRATVAPAGRNSIYSVLFPFGSTRVMVGEATASRLIADARVAPLILLRGRTDGRAETSAESRIARERAAAVQAFLVQAGIEPARIRATWQPVGDHAADNELSGGRTLNRRVEIEIYHAAPELIALTDAGLQ